MLYPKKLVSELVRLAYFSDREVRADLVDGYIANENDYTSNFTSVLRRKIRSRNLPGLSATSHVLKKPVETRYGCDAAIILSNQIESKICLFEAKWPRFKNQSFRWDRLQKGTQVSHFDDQLNRQSQYISQFSIWEMIYCDFPYRSKTTIYPNFGSTCVWADEAISFSLNRSRKTVPWSDHELQSLMSKSKRGIGHMISATCQCKRGRPLTGMDTDTLIHEFGLPTNVLAISFTGKEDNYD